MRPDSGGTNMQELLDAGITDLGGEGDLLLEIEYNNDKGEFKEAVYHLPESCNKQDIVDAGLLHVNNEGNEQVTFLTLNFNQHDTFTIPLPDKCRDLVEVRLPEAVGGDNITALFG